MEDAIRDALKDVIARHGRELLDDRRRCEYILKENCPPNAKREVAALIVTLEQGVPRRLLSMPAASVTAATIMNYAARIADDTGLRQEVAHGAVEAWAYGLGLRVAAPNPARTEPVQDVMALGRTCPFCGAMAAATVCAACGRDTTAPRRLCPTCGKMTPSTEPKCWNCGTKLPSDLSWKIPLIVLLFVLALVASILISLIR